MTLKTQDFPTVLAALKELGGTDRDKAAALGVQSTKTIERLRQRLPAALKPFIAEPRLLRALLADIDRMAA
jgi:hypothetical protein